MDNKAKPLPQHGNYHYGYQLAYRLASEQLAGTDDLEPLCRRSGAQIRPIHGKKIIVIQYLGRSYCVSHPEIEVSPEDSREPVPLKDKLLILHYLNRAKGSPISGRAITYKELPEGISYITNFTKRAIKPLLNNFGQQPERLPDTAKALFGARRADYGDAAVTIDAFPRVPVTLVLWQGDEELAPEGNILFDGTIPDYLSTEDITVLCETIVWKLVSSIPRH